MNAYHPSTSGNKRNAGPDAAQPSTSWTISGQDHTSDSQFTRGFPGGRFAQTVQRGQPRNDSSVDAGKRTHCGNSTRVYRDHNRNSPPRSVECEGGPIYLHLYSWGAALILWADAAAVKRSQSRFQPVFFTRGQAQEGKNVAPDSRQRSLPNCPVNIL